MDPVGAWLRQLLKAGMAAALVPAAMLAALVVVLVGAGGFGGLGALGQLLSGPLISPAERLASSDRANRRDIAPVAPADPRAPARADAPAAPSARRTPPPPATGAREGRPLIDPQGPPRVRPPPRPVLAAPPPPPPPPVARQPTLKERTRALGDKLKDTVGEVGMAVQEIVDALGQTLRRILNPPRAPAP
jgi:hypothetical protein